MAKPTIQQIEADLMDDGKPRAISIAADGSIGVVEVHGLDTASKVFFYEQDFYVLSNFSAFVVHFRGIDFNTSEEAYHFQRFAGDGVRDDVRNAHISALLRCRSAHEAFRYAQEYKRDQRPDWDAVKVDVMRDILRAKAEQHEYVARKLLATGERELIENSWRDDFWGWGPHQDGQNMLGRLWMEIRSELRVKPRTLDEILTESDTTPAVDGLGTSPEGKANG